MKTIIKYLITKLKSLFKRKIEIVITKEDYNNSISYGSVHFCPLALAAKRALNDKNIIVGTSTIGSLDAKGDYQEIGEICPIFDYPDYLDLQSGVIKEFKTIFTPI